MPWQFAIGGRAQRGDTHSDPRLPEAGRVNARTRGYHSLVVVPMLRHNESMGSISVSRSEPGGSTDDEIALLQTFADRRCRDRERPTVQGVAGEHRERPTALERADRDERGAPGHQPGRRATRSPCSTHRCAERRTALWRRSMGGCTGSTVSSSTFGAAVAISPGPSGRSSGSRRSPGRLATVAGWRVAGGGKTARIFNVPGHRARTEMFTPKKRPEPYLSEHRDSGARCSCRWGAPGKQVIGVIGFSQHRNVDAFTKAHADLLQTFADQAVIAMENVRLFTELQTSNRELTTALETQTATSDILRVISGSRTDVQPVFEAIVQSAVRLLRGGGGGRTNAQGRRSDRTRRIGPREARMPLRRLRWRAVFPLDLQSAWNPRGGHSRRVYRSIFPTPTRIPG